MLAQTLVAVSERVQARVRDAVEAAAPGPERVRALLEAALPLDPEMVEAWRVWIAAYGEAVRSTRLRGDIERRLEPWWELIDHALEGATAMPHDGDTPVSWRFDALLNGFVIQTLTARSELSLEEIRDEMLRIFCEGAGRPLTSAG
jgi:AcrR family transcriptional regulator